MCESTDGWLVVWGKCGCVLLLSSTLWLQSSSYKRVTGRSHTGEKQISTHPHRPHATSPPSHRLSTDSPHN